MSKIHDGRGFYRKANPVKDPVLYGRYVEDFPYCQACGLPLYAAVKQTVSLTRHHIIKFRRSDERCNLLVLCSRDHDLAELRSVRRGGLLLPKLTLGVCLSLKLLRTPDEYDAERLAELFGQALPDLEPVPQFLVDEWRRWRKAG